MFLVFWSAILATLAHLPIVVEDAVRTGIQEQDLFFLFGKLTSFVLSSDQSGIDGAVRCLCLHYFVHPSCSYPPLPLVSETLTIPREAHDLLRNILFVG
uniref:Putative secreted peptide n=1 Tax=Anopheles braziliensis TaxID=58242 RepID=A0A2M3ZX20_9DIPT